MYEILSDVSPPEPKSNFRKCFLKTQSLNSFTIQFTAVAAPGFWFGRGNIGQNFIHEFHSSPVLRWRRLNLNKFWKFYLKIWKFLLNYFESFKENVNNHFEKLNENYNFLLLSILIAGWGLDSSPSFAIVPGFGGGEASPLSPAGYATGVHCTVYTVQCTMKLPNFQSNANKYAIDPLVEEGMPTITLEYYWFWFNNYIKQKYL